MLKRINKIHINLPRGPVSMNLHKFLTFIKISLYCITQSVTCCNPYLLYTFSPSLPEETFVSVDADSLQILLSFALAHGSVNTILDVLQILLGKFGKFFIATMYCFCNCVHDILAVWKNKRYLGCLAENSLNICHTICNIFPCTIYMCNR